MGAMKNFDIEIDTIKEMDTREKEKIAIYVLNEMLEGFYLDYFNNFLTIEKFSEHFGFSNAKGRNIIKMGKEIHEEKHDEN